jgi:hypothetical protein
MDVSMPGGQTQARFMGGPLYRIAEVDQSVFPEELPPIEIDISTALDAALTPDAPQSLSDSAGSIDVLVAYTPAARSAAGGATAMANLITLAVAETNQSYLNSGMSQRINLVKAVETPYTQSGDMGTDLDRAVNPSDGYMDELPGLRNQYGADLVSVIEEVSQYCGISYHMASISSAFAPYAYSMVARVCATGYYSLAHEMGHNMGARHDYYVDNAGSPTTYAHGYVSLAGRWRTIMAYDSQCNAKGYTCTRLPFWSNPQVRYGGAVMGVAGGTRSNCPTNSTSQYACDADNHRLLNESAATAANFRQHVGAPPSVTI